jgi:hypothetical protein
LGVDPFIGTTIVGVSTLIGSVITIVVVDHVCSQVQKVACCYKYSYLFSLDGRAFFWEVLFLLVLLLSWLVS